jgi:glycosyltransferase A (GT-A) superfamily protein (DUF2064 family)
MWRLRWRYWRGEPRHAWRRPTDEHRGHRLCQGAGGRPGQDAPVAGAGAGGAAALAERMLRHALAQATAAGVGPVELCAAPDASHPALREAAAACGAALAEQGPGDLGQRMHRALGATWPSRPCAADGHRRPGAGCRCCARRRQALQHHDVVFVPALDGGYALVGQRRADPRWFHDMTWSHAA